MTKNALKKKVNIRGALVLMVMEYRDSVAVKTIQHGAGWVTPPLT